MQKIFKHPILNLIVDIGNNSSKYYLFNGKQLVLHSRRNNGTSGILSGPVDQFTEMFRMQAIADKKADKILADVKGVKTMQEALALNGVKSDTLRRVNFASPAYVSKVPASEPALSGAAATLEEGVLSAPIKGNGGIYFLQVIKKNLLILT